MKGGSRHLEQPGKQKCYLSKVTSPALREKRDRSSNAGAKELGGHGRAMSPIHCSGDDCEPHIPTAQLSRHELGSHPSTAAHSKKRKEKKRAK